MTQRLTKDQLQERKERNIGYLRDLFPNTRQQLIYVHCLRRTDGGRKLYRIYAVARRQKDEPEIINISGIVSHVTGVRWDQKTGGVWTTEIAELIGWVSRIIYPERGSGFFNIVTL